MAQFTATIWPPLVFPRPDPISTAKLATPAAPPMPSMVAPRVAATNMNVTVAPAVNTLQPKSAITTQQGIYNIFGIVDPRLQNQAP